jgi:hypothetical protein
MKTHLMMDYVHIYLYGYRGQKWIKTYDDGKIWHEAFFAKVPDDFTLERVIGCYHNYSKPDYREGLLGHIVAYCTETEKSTHSEGETDETDETTETVRTWSSESHLPFGDPALYSIVDNIRDLARLLGLTENEFLDEYSVKAIKELLDRVYAETATRSRLLGWLKGKDTYSLLEDVDAAHLRSEQLKADLAKEKAINLDLKEKLETALGQVKMQAERIEFHQAESNRLQAQHDGYKKELLSIVQNAMTGYR